MFRLRVTFPHVPVTFQLRSRRSEPDRLWQPRVFLRDCWRRRPDLNRRWRFCRPDRWSKTPNDFADFLGQWPLDVVPSSAEEGRRRPHKLPISYRSAGPENDREAGPYREPAHPPIVRPSASSQADSTDEGRLGPSGFPRLRHRLNPLSFGATLPGVIRARDYPVSAELLVG